MWISSFMGCWLIIAEVVKLLSRLMDLMSGLGTKMMMRLIWKVKSQFSMCYNSVSPRMSQLKNKLRRNLKKLKWLLIFWMMMKISPFLNHKHLSDFNSLNHLKLRDQTISLSFLKRKLLKKIKFRIEGKLIWGRENRLWKNWKKNIIKVIPWIFQKKAKTKTNRSKEET